MSIIKFDCVNDLITKANNTIYGLAAGVMTKDLDRAMHLAHSIRAGTVWLVFNLNINKIRFIFKLLFKLFLFFFLA